VDLSELSRKGLVEKFQSDPNQIRNQVEIAKGDLSSGDMEQYIRQGVRGFPVERQGDSEASLLS
jgi:hypothetical protein